MHSYILGFPKDKPQTIDSITEYTDLQSCSSATRGKFVTVHAESLEKAKERFMELADNNFEPKIIK